MPWDDINAAGDNSGAFWFKPAGVSTSLPVVDTGSGISPSAGEGSSQSRGEGSSRLQNTSSSQHLRDDSMDVCGDNPASDAPMDYKSDIEHSRQGDSPKGSEDESSDGEHSTPLKRAVTPAPRSPVTPHDMGRPQQGDSPKSSEDESSDSEYSNPFKGAVTPAPRSPVTPPAGIQQGGIGKKSDPKPSQPRDSPVDSEDESSDSGNPNPHSPVTLNSITQRAPTGGSYEKGIGKRPQRQVTPPGPDLEEDPMDVDEAPEPRPLRPRRKLLLGTEDFTSLGKRKEAPLAHIKSGKNRKVSRAPHTRVDKTQGGSRDDPIKSGKKSKGSRARHPSVDKMQGSSREDPIDIDKLFVSAKTSLSICFPLTITINPGRGNSHPRS